MKSHTVGTNPELGPAIFNNTEMIHNSKYNWTELKIL